MLNQSNYRDEPGSLVTIRLIDLPKERYIRHVVRTVLDDVSKYDRMNAHLRVSNEIFKLAVSNYL